MSVSVQAWHNRLGHLPSKCFDKLKEQLYYNAPKFPIHSPCYVCPLAKQRQLPFVSHNHRSPCPFDLVHYDIWCPFQVPNYSGHRYFLTLVDDCTCFTWLFLLKNKYDVSHKIPRFFKLVSTQFNMKIKAFRSNDTKELLFTDIFAEMGVVHQFSCVERPQQNSVAKRKHQHLLNVA